METTGTQPTPDQGSQSTGNQSSPTFSFSGYVEDAKALQGCGFGRRAGARIIDMVLHYIIGWCGGMMLGFVIGIVSVLTHQSIYDMLARLRTGPGWPPFVGGMLGYVAFTTILEGLHGSTPGKLMLGMVAVKEDGRPCGIRGALIRSLGYFVDSLFFGVVGYMAMSKSGRQQRYGDEWAGTIVAQRQSIAPENLRGAGAFVAALLLAVMADAMFIITGVLVKMWL